MTNIQQFNLNPDIYLGQLQQAILNHMGELRNTLRSIEDSSFLHKAKLAKPNSVIQLHLGSIGENEAKNAEFNAVNRCFLDVIRSLIVYLDRMIAIKECLKEEITLEHSLNGFDEVNVFIERCVNDKYEKIARDARLTNPKKLDKFPSLSDFTKNSALSYFSLRRCLEHHSGLPNENLKIFVRKTILAADGKSISEVPFYVTEGTNISLQIVEEEKIFEKDNLIKLSESDIENVCFTVHSMIAQDIRRDLIT